MKELKDLLNPPFKKKEGNSIERLIVDQDNNRVCMAKEYKGVDLPKFIIEALNSEWQRQFGQERWVILNKVDVPNTEMWQRLYKKGFRYFCPKCEYVQDIQHKFCSHCGVRLLPPEGEECMK